ncbi:MAG: ATP-dependent helicase, partial [Bacillota bacterium]
MLETDSLLQDLTEAQREAVTHVDGPLLIIAGAGSGKTRVITRRVAYLMSLGIPPASILAITFTNKAAGEMKTRVSDQLVRPLRDFGRLDQPWPLICTFHSLGLRVLKHYAQRIGLPSNFTIYDASDQERIIKEAIKLADLSATNFPPSTCHNAISTAKNKLMSAELYAQTQTDFFGRSIAKVFKHYQQLLNQNNAMDFDDLLLRTAQAFRDHPDILRELQDRFQYILIDEYQDTNHAQYVVAHAMALRHRNIAVVGDPDQSIYAWRGADIQNILDFEKDYPDAKVVKLEQNYRSTQLILEIASSVIDHNHQRKKKRLWTENAKGDPARLLLCGDEQEEALAIAAQLKELHEKGINYSDMAIFYRINALSRVMEDALRRSGLPYRIARGVDFYHRKEIKDVLAYLKVVVNPNDELSLARIINVPARGISDNTVKQMQAHALSNQWSLWQTLQNIGQITGVSSRAQTAIQTFVQLVQRWQGLASRSASDSGKGRIQSLIESVVKTSGYEAYLRKIGDNELSELANVNELISAAAQFDKEMPEATLEDYLGQVSLVSDVDVLEDNGAITLMTLHAAKGLEFPVVAMIAMEDGVLPHGRVREHPEQLEEERRLCFVGITRAQQHLIFSRANYRTIRGLRERTIASRFLAEMPPEDLQILDTTGSGLDEDADTLQTQAETASSR